MSILLITNKADITTDFIVKSLTAKKLSFYRLNTEEIGESVAVNLDFDSKKYIITDRGKNISFDLLSFTSVYFRRPEVNENFNDLTTGERNFIRSELLFLLEGLYKILKDAFWINTVEAIRGAENKIYQLVLAKEIGFKLPKSIITNVKTEAKAFYIKNKERCIIKPIKSGLVAGNDEEGVIFTNEVKLDGQNIERINQCPVYVQNLVLKQGDIRATVVGNRLFTALIHSQEEVESQIDWRKSSLPLRHSQIALPQDIAEKCLQLTKKLNLNFGAIDFILDEDGNYIFLEINPNGQWAWIEKQLNYSISDEITTLLAESKIL